MTCQSCGRETIVQSKFCNYCGERTAVACPSCKTLNPPDSLFCHDCGRSLTESHAEPQKPVPVAGDLTQRGSHGVGCPRCGSANEPASAYCFQCGLPLDGELRPEAGAAAVSAHAYRSARTRAVWTSALLVVTGIAILIYMGVTIEVLDLKQRYEAGEYLALSQLAGAEENRDFALGFYFLAFMATAIAFLMWVHRASRNLRALGAIGQRFSPGWAVGWWFVPIMFFFRPYQIMAEIWRGSTPDASRGATLEWRAAPVSTLLAWWWAFWLLANLISSIVGFSVGAGEISTGAMEWGLLSYGLEICAAVLAIAVVWRTTSRQDAKHRGIVSGSPWAS